MQIATITQEQLIRRIQGELRNEVLLIKDKILNKDKEIRNLFTNLAKQLNKELKLAKLPTHFDKMSEKDRKIIVQSMKKSDKDRLNFEIYFPQYWLITKEGVRRNSPLRINSNGDIQTQAYLDYNVNQDRSIPTEGNIKESETYRNEFRKLKYTDLPRLIQWIQSKVDSVSSSTVIANQLQNNDDVTPKVVKQIKVHKVEEKPLPLLKANVNRFHLLNEDTNWEEVEQIVEMWEVFDLAKYDNVIIESDNGIILTTKGINKQFSIPTTVIYLPEGKTKSFKTKTFSFSKEDELQSCKAEPMYDRKFFYSPSQVMKKYKLDGTETINSDYSSSLVEVLCGLQGSIPHRKSDKNRTKSLNDFIKSLNESIERGVCWFGRPLSDVKNERL